MDTAATRKYPDGIQTFSEKTGRQMVAISYEYDAPLHNLLHEKAILPDFRRLVRVGIQFDRDTVTVG